MKLSYTIFAFVFFFLLLGSFGFFLEQQHRKKNPKYWIRSIVQTGPTLEALKTSFLAELLDLSQDKPKNLFAFNLKKAKKKLLSSNMILEAELEKIPPSTLYIDYTVRTPIAWIADFENLLIDKEGYLFPAYPFFSPKNLPKIFLGTDPTNELEWSQPLYNDKIKLVFAVLKALEKMQKELFFTIQTIDVSKSFSGSFGKREIVVELTEECFFEQNKKTVAAHFPHFLRLNSKNYLEQLSNYMQLWDQMIEDYKEQLSLEKLEKPLLFLPRVIDLRIDEMAFIDQAE